MPAIQKKICKSCGQLSKIENNKCTQCGAEYADKAVEKARNELKLLFSKPDTGHLEVNTSKPFDASPFVKKLGGGDKQSDTSDERHIVNNNIVQGNPRTQDEYVEAKCDYDTDGVDDFKINRGDIITVINRRSDGIIDGKIGYLEVTFPKTVVKPYKKPERSLQISTTPDTVYGGSLEVQCGNIVTLKNKSSEYFWVEYKGKEGWIHCSCVCIEQRNEADVKPPVRPKPTKSEDSYIYLSPEKHDQPPKDEPNEETRIILLGKTGSGKSATGNAIIGDNFFKSNLSGKSVTKECQKFEGKCKGKKYVLIDTPGLFDTSLSQKTITDEIIRCAHLSLPGPHVFLIVLQITRVTKEETESLQQLFEIFGTSMGNYAMIVFTRSDELKREGKSIESFIAETGSPITDFIKKCNDRYIAIDNTTTGQDKDRMVTELLKVIRDMVNDNNGSHFTNKIIDEAAEALVELNKTEDLNHLDAMVFNLDVDEDENDGYNSSIGSHDSGISILCQPIYDEIYAEFHPAETELYDRIDKAELEIVTEEKSKKELHEINEKAIEEIDLELAKKRRELDDIVANHERVTNQCRTIEQQKKELERKAKNDTQECDSKLKLLSKNRKLLEKKKRQIALKKNELRQRITKESANLQTELNTPQNGCLLM